VRRNELFRDSFHQVNALSAAELCGKLSIEFIGEEVIN
jgi:hypothetical protein